MKSVFVTASFMSLGLCEGTGNGFFNRVLDHWDNGCYELIDRLTSYAPYACALIEAGYQSVGSFPAWPTTKFRRRSASGSGKKS